MLQRSFKLSAELDARLVAAARADDRSVSWVVVRALEQALGGAVVARPAGPEGAGHGVGAEKAPCSPVVVSAPARTSDEPLVGTPLPKIASRRSPR